jgi:AraC-like DNA-binding protein
MSAPRHQARRSKVAGRAMSEVDEPTMVAEAVYAKFRSAFEPYLEAAGIDRSVLGDPNALVPLAKHARLMELAAAGAGDDCLGLHIGLRIRPSDLGAIGFAVTNSPTVGAALENFARYLKAYTRGCFFSLERSDSEARYSFSYTLPELGVMDRRQEAECTLALVMSLIRAISDKCWCPTRVVFEHPRPEDASEHERMFHAPVEFGGKINQLIFDAAFLDRPVAAAEARLFSVIEEHLQHVIDSQADDHDLVSQVSNLVTREFSNGVPSIDWVAEQMGMTRRTLQRRLSDRGVGFSQIIDDVRRNMALQYVAKSNLKLTEITTLLGYSHVSAFCRSFRRWTGTTPQNVRDGEVDLST